jgi:hypothetical protein
MKTANFKAFENDKIQKNEMNYLVGGARGEDILIPPRK